MVVLLAMAISCKKDPLDITPDGRLTIKAVFENEIQTEAFLNTVYSSIPSYFAGYSWYSFLSPLSDESQDSDVGNEVGNGVTGRWIVGSLTPSDDPTTFGSASVNTDHYTSFWAGIRNANVFLQNIDNAKVSDAGKRSRLKAEAQILRAFYYWELIKKYGPMPVVDKPFEPGFDYSVLTRPSFQTNIDFIVKDCDAAISNPDLPIRITQASEGSRFSKAVAYAIKSEALLYNASPLWNPGSDASKWTAAAAASKAALTALTIGNEYALASDYESYFLNPADFVSAPRDMETIYERPGGLPAVAIANNSITAKTGSLRAGTCPSQELVDSYDMKATGQPAITGYQDADHLLPVINAASGYKETDPYAGRDPRFYATVWHNNANYDNIAGAGKLYPLQIYTGGADQLIKTPPNKRNTHTGYYLRKYINSKLANTLAQSAGWKKYRLAEIYLNYAEAENEASGATSEAYSAINAVRTRATMPNLPVGLTKDQMRERIHRERRVELAIEEHRFWDVRRWKTLDQTDKLVTGMQITKNADGTFTYNRFVTERRNAWQDKFRIFPIPIGDAARIPDLNKNQNPGW